MSEAATKLFAAINHGRATGRALRPTRLDDISYWTSMLIGSLVRSACLFKRRKNGGASCFAAL
jgi:hypothetical protein